MEEKRKYRFSRSYMLMISNSNEHLSYLISIFFSAIRMFKNTGEVFVQKPGEDVPKVFTFDSVYDWNSEQQEIFAETAYPVCENVIQGYNGTIFAYGQTGTGKTFTITGIENDADLKGIMPRAFENIFQQIQSDTRK